MIAGSRPAVAVVVVAVGVATLGCPMRARAASPPAPDVRAAFEALRSAIDSGDSVRIAAVVRERYAPRALAAPGAFERATTRWLEQYVIHGPSTVDSVIHSDGRMVRAWLRGDLTRAWTEMLVFADSAAPERIVRVSVGRGLLPPYLEARRLRLPVSSFAPELRRYLDGLARHDRFSGVVLVTGRGRDPFVAAYGYADEHRRVPVTRTTPFNLASVGKLFTSIAVATLVRDGRLSLDDTVSRYLPALPVGDRMTIGHLLRHMSGLGELGAAFDTVDFRTAAEYLPRFTDTSLVFPPGTRTEYSNRGYVVAGAVVERIAGEPFADYVRRAVMDRLGLRHAGFLDPADGSSGRAIGFTYYPTIRGGFVHGPRRPNTALVRRGSPAGGSYASADEMLRLAEALRTRALGGAIFSLETATEYGLMISPDRLWFGHAGAHPGVSAQVWTSPELGMSTVVLSNYDVVAGHVASTIMELAQSTRPGAGAR